MNKCFNPFRKLNRTSRVSTREKALKMISKKIILKVEVHLLLLLELMLLEEEGCMLGLLHLLDVGKGCSLAVVIGLLLM